MKHRFKIGDWIYYIGKLHSPPVLIGDRLPLIRSDHIVDMFLAGGYKLRNGVLLDEPVIYATREEAEYEHTIALLRYLKEVSEARDAAITKLKEYGLESFDIGDHENLDALLYARKQAEHIRSIPEDKRTPAMEAVLLAVDHPCVEGP